jgi:RNA methyltransferase, TrmH family
MDISKNQIKFVRSLHQSKFRQNYKKFIGEGHKVVIELIKSKKFAIDSIYCSDKWFQDNHDIIKNFQNRIFIIDDEKMDQITTLKNSSSVLAVFDQSTGSLDDLGGTDGHFFYLDNIQDPGNVGTIIRIGDWFGFSGIIASEGTADFFHPKVVHASMGSIARPSLIYAQPDVMSNFKSNFDYYALDMNGVDYNQVEFKKKSIFILGNEGHGLSIEAKKLVDYKNVISIPGSDNKIAESLNVAMTASILASKTIKSK